MKPFADTQTTNRRRYQRFPGNGVMASVQDGSRFGKSLVIRDVSRGGMALLTDWEPAAGRLLVLTIGACFDPIRSRVVRIDGGALILTFGQDEANLFAVDRAIGLAARRLGLPSDLFVATSGA